MRGPGPRRTAAAPHAEGPETAQPSGPRASRDPLLACCAGRLVLR